MRRPTLLILLACLLLALGACTAVGDPYGSPRNITRAYMHAVNTHDKDLFVSLFSSHRHEIAELLYDNLAESGLTYGGADFETFWSMYVNPQGWENEMNVGVEAPILSGSGEVLRTEFRLTIYYPEDQGRWYVYMPR